MRITKKFAGSSCIGKQVFIPRDGPIDDKELAEIQDDLKVLEKTFMSKIDCQHRQQSYQMAGMTGSQGAVIAAALQSQASAAMGLSMPSPYMNVPMDGTGMGIPSTSNHGNYPPELLAAFHPHHAATMSMPLPMHPMLTGGGGINGPGGGPSLAGYPNMYYAFPPPSHNHHPQQQPPSMGSRKGSRKGSSSSDSSDSGPDANSAYHMAMHANEAAIREMKANLPNIAGTSRQLSNNTNVTMNNSSSSSSSSSHGMGSTGSAGAPIYRSRQSYTSAELFGRQYPTTLEHMAFLSSENLEASRKKRSSDGNNVLLGGNQLHVPGNQKHNNSHSKGSSSSSSKGKKGSIGRVIPADPIDLDASSLLLNFFQSTNTVPEETKSDTSNGTSSHEVTFASGVDGHKHSKGHDGEGGDIHHEHKNKKAKTSRSSKNTTTEEKGQPSSTTDTVNVLPDKQEAPSTSTDGKLNGSRGKYKSSTSSGSGRTSNGSGTGSGDGDNDDSASTFSDAGDADASNSISGRSSSLSSDRSDNSDYSSPDEKEQKNQQRNRHDYEEKTNPLSSTSGEVDLESRSRMVQEGVDNMNEMTEQSQPQQ